MGDGESGSSRETRKPTRPRRRVPVVLPAVQDERAAPAPPGQTGDFTASQILQLQRTAGNQRVTHLLTESRERHADQGPPGARSAPAARSSVAVLQRLTRDEKSEDLKSPRFAGNTRLEAAFDNSPALRRGERDRKGENAIALVQAALIDDGFEMPISTKKTGTPDGDFGKETTRVVQQFQAKHALLEKGQADGVLGRHTLGKLDELNRPPAPPVKKDPEIEANEKALGENVAKDMEKANDDPATPDSGIWYSYNYEAKCIGKNRDPAFEGRWREDYRLGFASPVHFHRLGFMDWRLKPKMSASEAIKQWLKGLTIAECLSTVIAIQYDTVRAAVGDAKFDETFGSADRVLPEDQRMRIAAGGGGTQPIFALMKRTDATKAGDPGEVGNHKGLKVGEWYYFYNHPNYLLKHPGGAWQGENSIFMGTSASGEQLWSGLGTRSDATGSSKVTEDDLFLEMIADYNRPRDADDERALKAIRAGNRGKLPSKYLLPEQGGSAFENTTTKEKILNDPPSNIDGTERKGGFLLKSGAVLDAAAVQTLRDS